MCSIKNFDIPNSIMFFIKISISIKLNKRCGLHDFLSYWKHWKLFYASGKNEFFKFVQIIVYKFIRDFGCGFETYIDVSFN